MRPIQPLSLDKHGVIRFEENAIVRHLLDKGPFDLNDIACIDFTQEDREQFAQLIGYSLSGAGDLGYFSAETWEAAEEMYENGTTEKDARIKCLQETLNNVREAAQVIATELAWLLEEQ